VLSQMFCVRNVDFGVMIELIERSGCELFKNNDLDILFAALELKAIF